MVSASNKTSLVGLIQVFVQQVAVVVYVKLSNVNGRSGFFCETSILNFFSYL